jgi:hypothetical protein
MPFIKVNHIFGVGAMLMLQVHAAISDNAGVDYTRTDGSYANAVPL